MRLKKANKQMKDIYLSKPYQVLTFAQVNKRQCDHTPTRAYSVYRADHNLQIKTSLFKERANVTASQVSNGSGMKISDEASYKGYDKSSSRFLSPAVRGGSRRNDKSVPVGSRAEVIKDTESIEIGPNQDSVSYEFSTAQLRQIKHRRAAVEADIKAKFVENLIAQIDKRIEQCNF